MMAAALVACSREEQPANPETPTTYTLSIKANLDAGTKGLSLNDNTLNATWDGSERVYVFNASNEQLTFLTPHQDAQLNTSTCTLEGSFLPGKIPAADDVLTLILNAANYSNQEGTLAFIAGHDDYAVATVTVKEVDTVNGTITIKEDNADFVSQQAIIKFTLKDKANNAAISPTQLTVTDGTNTASVTTVSSTYTENGAGVLYVAFPATGEAKTINLAATVGDYTYTYETPSTKTLTNGQYYTITVKMSCLRIYTNTSTTQPESLSAGTANYSLNGSYNVVGSGNANITATGELDLTFFEPDDNNPLTINGCLDFGDYSNSSIRFNNQGWSQYYINNPGATALKVSGSVFVINDPCTLHINGNIDCSNEIYVYQTEVIVEGDIIGNPKIYLDGGTILRVKGSVGNVNIVYWGNKNEYVEGGYKVYDSQAMGF